MKHLQKFYKKGVKVLVIILIGFLSGALGSFVTLQLYQKQGNQATIIILALSLKHPIR